MLSFVETNAKTLISFSVPLSVSVCVCVCVCLSLLPLHVPECMCVCALSIQHEVMDLGNCMHLVEHFFSFSVDPFSEEMQK